MRHRRHYPLARVVTMKTILPLFALVLALWGRGAWAQTDGDLPDADLPDATVGQGGPDMSSEESNDGMAGAACMRAGDCAAGFDCVKNVCAYAGTRNATCAGCGSGLEPIGLLLMLGVMKSFPERKKGPPPG